MRVPENDTATDMPFKQPEAISQSKGKPPLYQEFFSASTFDQVYVTDFFSRFNHSVGSVGCLARCERSWCMACALDNSVPFYFLAYLAMC